MWFNILIVFFFGGLVGLDTTAAWQVLFSHPLFACAVLGIVYGEPQLGLFFGIIFELIWLYDIPIGGAKFPEGNLSSFIGLMITFTLLPRFSGAESWLVLLSSTYAVLNAYLLGITMLTLRRVNLYLVNKADRYADIGNPKRVERMHLLGIVYSYFHNAVLGVIFFLFGVFLLILLRNWLPSSSGFSLHHLQAVFLGIGLMIMIDLFLTKKKMWYFFLGIVCGIGLGYVM